MPKISKQCARGKGTAIVKVTIMDNTNTEIWHDKFCADHWVSFAADAIAKGFNVAISRICAKKGSG